MRYFDTFKTTGATAAAVAAVMMTAGCGHSGGGASLGGGLAGNSGASGAADGGANVAENGNAGAGGSGGGGGGSVGGGAAGGGGGGASGGNPAAPGPQAATGGALTRLVGNLSTAGNLPVVGPALNTVTTQGDAILNPLARVDIADQSVLGAGGGSSQQLVGASALSPDQTAGTLVTAGILAGPAAGGGVDQLAAINLGDQSVLNQGGQPLIGVGLLSPTTPQGSLATVGLPATAPGAITGTVTGAVGGVTNTVAALTGGGAGSGLGGLGGVVGGVTSTVSGLVPGL